MSGWVKIHRSLIKHWIWDNPEYFKAWICIIIEANYESAKVLIEGEVIECKRGQSLNSLKTWAKLFGKRWSIQRVRTFLNLLKNDTMIVTEVLRKTTRLTICNYDKYQFEQQANNTEITRRQHGDNTEVTTNKKNKKVKKERISLGRENHLEIIPAEKIKTWRTDFETYKEECRIVFTTLSKNEEFIKELQHYFPKLDIQKSIERSYRGYWGTEAGWKNKKSDKDVKTINWKTTLINNLNRNAVYPNTK
jgi:hypothetical protein